MKLGHKLHTWCQTKIYWPHQNLHSLRWSTGEFFEPPLPKKNRYLLSSLKLHTQFQRNLTTTQCSSPVMFQRLFTTLKTRVVSKPPNARLFIHLSFFVFSSPVRRTESYSDTPGVSVSMSVSVSISVSVSVSVKMLKFLVQVISFLMFLSTTLFFTDYNIQIHILL